MRCVHWLAAQAYGSAYHEETWRPPIAFLEAVMVSHVGLGGLGRARQLAGWHSASLNREGVLHGAVGLSGLAGCVPMSISSSTTPAPSLAWRCMHSCVAQEDEEPSEPGRFKAWVKAKFTKFNTVVGTAWMHRMLEGRCTHVGRAGVVNSCGNPAMAAPPPTLQQQMLYARSW